MAVESAVHNGPDSPIAIDKEHERQMVVRFVLKPEEHPRLSNRAHRCDLGMRTHFGNDSRQPAWIGMRLEQLVTDSSPNQQVGLVGRNVDEQKEIVVQELEVEGRFVDGFALEPEHLAAYEFTGFRRSRKDPIVMRVVRGPTIGVVPRRRVSEPLMLGGLAVPSPFDLQREPLGDRVDRLMHRRRRAPSTHRLAVHHRVHLGERPKVAGGILMLRESKLESQHGS